MNIPPKSCCGCSACAAICPVQAIKMTKDPQGFYLPEINSEKCIKCNLCLKTCPECNNEVITKKPLKAIALIINSESDRIKSTSGGAFTALSNYLFEMHGAVFGTVYDETFKAIIICAQDKEQRDRMRGSKYVESSSENSYAECSELLRKNVPVLFTGTPCQIAGLVRFLDNDHVCTDQLYTCQIVCHGTPSPRVFRDHLNNIQLKRKKKIEKYYHRPKIWGWHEHNEMVCYHGGKKESQSKISQDHKELFYLGYSLRESCFQCKYAGNPGYSDFTIGDFWGVEFIAPEMDDNKGTSILLINSEKGNRLFTAINKDNLKIEEINVDDALKYNHVHPSKKPTDYDNFWNDYNNTDFSKVVKKYAKDKMPDNIIYYAKKWVRRILVKMHLIGY